LGGTVDDVHERDEHQRRKYELLKQSIDFQMNEILNDVDHGPLKAEFPDEVKRFNILRHSRELLKSSQSRSSRSKESRKASSSDSSLELLTSRDNLFGDDDNGRPIRIEFESGSKNQAEQSPHVG